jgi:hypothetical protein
LLDVLEPSEAAFINSYALIPVPGNTLAGGGRKMANGDIEKVKRYVEEQMQALPRIEEKLESNNNKILYLIKRLNQLAKARGAASEGTLTQQRLVRLAERLHRLGVVVEYADGRGCVKLRPIDQRGVETIKRLNMLFPVSLVESFLENASA